MNREDIIKLAKECGHWSGQTVEMNDVGLKRFAALVAAAGREKVAEELHLQAAAYANKRKDAYVDLMKKGSVEKLNQKMIGWIWVAHYEGFRDAMQEKNNGH